MGGTGQTLFPARELTPHFVLPRSSKACADEGGRGAVLPQGGWGESGFSMPGCHWVTGISALLLFLILHPAPLTAQTSLEVKSYQKISDTAGGFTAILDNSDLFGISVANLGDLDGDLIPDLAVGAQLDDDGGFNRGAVYVLFMNADGTVKSHQKISNTLYPVRTIRAK